MDNYSSGTDTSPSPDEPQYVVMKIRRTETSWLIQSRRRDSGPGGPDIASSVPASSIPASSVPASLAQVPDIRDLPPLVLRK